MCRPARFGLTQALCSLNIRPLYYGVDEKEAGTPGCELAYLAGLLIPFIAVT